MNLIAIEQSVIEQLGWYVYRLIDLRNGETFYVGKGKGSQILLSMPKAP